MSSCCTVVLLLWNILQFTATSQLSAACNESNVLTDLKKIDWGSIGSTSDNIPIINVSLQVSSSSLDLDIIASLEYLGTSIADNMDGYGITYVLDFESFNAHSSSISNPGLCSNRLQSEFDNTPFDEWWDYSLCPSLSHQIAQNDSFLAYPQPSKYWSLSYESTTNNIKYDASFKLSELLLCDGIITSNNDKWLNISGTFYINLVSPLSKQIDIGYYYIYQLYSSPFIIAIQKTINILSSTGISIFTITIISVYKQDKEQKYKLILLTESADYLYLKPNQLLLSPYSNLIISPSDDKTNDGKCVSIKNNICSQMFEITNNNALTCAQDKFSGQYIVRFNVECNPNANTTQELAICESYLDAHHGDNDIIDLEASLSWEDNICNTNTFLIKFKTSMQFYIDEIFSNKQSDDGLFEIGEDRVYVKVNLNEYESDDDIFDIIDLSLTNVWLCTVKESDELSLDSTLSTINSGCFSSNIDIDGPYHIIENGEIAIGYDDIDANIYNDDDINDVRFSFIVPDTIVRTKLYVHVQLNIDIIEQETNIRRRLMTDIDIEEQMDQIRHYMDTIALKKRVKYLENKLNEQEKKFTKWTNSWLSIVFVILIIAFMAILFAIWTVYKNCKFNGTTFYGRYSMISKQTETEMEDNEEEDNSLIWNYIIEDQQEKANSV